MNLYLVKYLLAGSFCTYGVEILAETPAAACEVLASRKDGKASYVSATYLREGKQGQ